MALPNITGYTTIERLGTGGFASVYLATADDGHERVAIKILHAHTTNDSDIRRFNRERVTMAAFSGHPNIVSVLDSDQTDEDEHYMVLEYIDGGSVRDLLKDEGALHWTDTLRIAVQICSALDVAHRSGVLHRDVKPGNILLSNDQAKLGDFGIARLIGQSQVTAAQSIIGTLAYTPPEVFHNSGFDGRGDIYQLGITMYEMLLGRAPFTSAAADNKAAIIRRIIDKPAPLLAPFDIPQSISDLLEEVLAKDPADRPQTAKRLAERLNAIEVELGQSPTPMYQEAPTNGALDTEATIHPGSIDTIHAPTMPIDMNNELDANPTIDAKRAANPEWPAAAAGSAIAATSAFTDSDTSEPGPAVDQQPPTPPVVTPPQDVNVTIAEPRPSPDTSIIKPVSAEAEAGELAGTAKSRRSGDNEPPKPSTPAAPAPTPEKGRRSRKPWLLMLLGLIIVGGAGALFALNGLDDEPVDGTDPGSSDQTATPAEDDIEEGEDTNDVESEPERTPEFASVDVDTFGEPAGTDGIVFGSVANSQGLTMVGSAGDGERVSDQRSIVWTLGADGFAVQRDLDESGAHRMWSIGVIDAETFLAVGDAPGIDGVAWTGTQAANFAEVTNPDLASTGRDQLRSAVADTSQDATFLVGGSRSDELTALWEVTGVPSWEDPTWTRIDLGDDTSGVINDIAVEGDLAVAVGRETIDGEDAGIILIRREDTWSNLIQPQANVQFWGVTIDGDQIIAVGEQNIDTTPTPVAVTSDSEGVGLIHVLPIRNEDGGSETGIARSVKVLADGSVIAVGDVDRQLDPEDGESGTDRDGAIWQYLSDQDVWTTRASPDLIADGFTQLWTINEWDGTVYVFGRTETADGRQPAGAWTLDLN